MELIPPIESILERKAKKMPISTLNERALIGANYDLIKFHLSQIGLLDIKYPDDRNGTEEEIATKREFHKKRIERLREERRMLCTRHATIEKIIDDGWGKPSVVGWNGLTRAEVVEYGYEV